MLSLYNEPNKLFAPSSVITQDSKTIVKHKKPVNILSFTTSGSPNPSFLGSSYLDLDLRLALASKSTLVPKPTLVITYIETNL